VHLKNADATKLATVLRAAFTSNAGGGGSAGGAATAPSATCRPAALQRGQPGRRLGNSATAPISRLAEPSTGGFVQADPSTNSLIITAPEPLYRQVRAMIDQLDTRRAQIYIESMIVEVSGDNAADFGFQWQGMIGNSGDRNLSGDRHQFTPNGGSGNIISLAQSIAGAAAGDRLGEGLNIGLIRNFGGTYGLAAIARIAAEPDQRPTSSARLTIDHAGQRGSQDRRRLSNVPFITGQFTNTGTATTSPFQTIERKDVGITLRIRPQVGEGGAVRMTIYQESSSVSDTVAPGTSQRRPLDQQAVRSSRNVVVDDGAHHRARRPDRGPLRREQVQGAAAGRPALSSAACSAARAAARTAPT
jgi:general secretion pathway protein D